MKLLLAAALFLTAAPAVASEPADLDFFVGAWSIHAFDGKAVGASLIEEQAQGAVYYEVRTVGEGAAQPLWFVNSEAAGGWTQLFLGPASRVRAFNPVSAPGEWPLVLGSDVVLQDGTAARFRMTISKSGDDKSRRVLELSKDGGATWSTVFDYEYRRAA